MPMAKVPGFSGTSSSTKTDSTMRSGDLTLDLAKEEVRSPDWKAGAFFFARGIFVGYPSIRGFDINQ